MIQFEGKISGHYLDVYSTLSVITRYYSMNNISRAITNKHSLSNNYKSSRNPFIIGGSKLDGRSTFSKGEKFFIGNTLSKVDEETGEIAFNNRSDNNKYDLIIRFRHGLPTLGAYFIFDSVNNEFPSKIKLEMHPSSGGEIVTKIYDITSSMTWVNFYFEDSNYDGNAYLYVTVLDWNKENRPVRIEAVFVTPIIEVNKSSLQSLERNLSSSSSCKEPSYGVISNNAQLTVLDIDGRIKSLIEDGMLNSTLHVEIRLVDTLSDVSDPVLKYDASEFSYDNNNLTLSVSMTDGLEALQDKDIGYIAVDKNTSLARTIQEFVPYSVAITVIDEELYNIYSSKDYVYSGTVWDNLNQLCNSNCIKAYVNERGYFVFRKMV